MLKDASYKEKIEDVIQQNEGQDVRGSAVCSLPLDIPNHVKHQLKLPSDDISDYQ